MSSIKKQIHAYLRLTVSAKLPVHRQTYITSTCIILTENPNKMQQCIKILLFLILNKAQHVSGDTPPIIRSLKLHKQPLVLHTWKVVGRVVGGRCQVA